MTTNPTIGQALCADNIHEAEGTCCPDGAKQSRENGAANIAELDRLRAELAKVREQLTAANRRADGLANDLRSAVKGNTAYANQTADGRKQAAAAIERMDINLGDAGWKHLEQKAAEASYPVEMVRRRRTRNDFTTDTIEAAYQYGYRQAAKVARTGATR